MNELTIEQLKSLEVGDWVWIVHLDINVGVYGAITNPINKECFEYEFVEGAGLHYYSDYGTKWVAYKNKEMAEANGEIVELPCVAELENVIGLHCDKQGIAKRCPRRIAQAVYKYLQTKPENRWAELTKE